MESELNCQGYCLMYADDGVPLGGRAASNVLIRRDGENTIGQKTSEPLEPTTFGGRIANEGSSMVLGRHATEGQAEFWGETGSLAVVPAHVFYGELNRLLAEVGFDRFVEELRARFYKAGGRGSIPPGNYFRMLFIGYMEGIDSQRGIAWRCQGSLSLRRFLDIPQDEETPDLCSLTRIGNRLPLEVHQRVFQLILELVQSHTLIKTSSVSVDSTLLDDELCRFDKRRGKRGKKKLSNDQWELPVDPEACIVKMKDGRTHLGYKAEHVIDLESEYILSAPVYHGTEADTATLLPSVGEAQENLVESSSNAAIEEVVAEAGYHGNETIHEATEAGTRTYIPEPKSRHSRRWNDKPDGSKETFHNNRKRNKRAKGKSHRRKRGERVEWSFAHVCEMGGGRRSWLRGLEKINKRCSIQTAARNLGLLMLKLFGIGKPKGRRIGRFGGGRFGFWAFPMVHWSAICRPVRDKVCPPWRPVRRLQLKIVGISIGC